MTNELKTQPTDDRPAYEPPHALRMDVPCYSLSLHRTLRVADGTRRHIRAGDWGRFGPVLGRREAYCQRRQKMVK
ncbi:MAG: hypothetical protein KKA73_30275 [Chloroflexi bacterium]|nr:hypothetical protein [Chloroflexota bacterium]MBU1751987.1 hypothetical protein [Chloroflexota bacterium]